MDAIGASPQYGDGFDRVAESPWDGVVFAELVLKMKFTNRHKKTVVRACGVTTVLKY